MRVSIRYRHPVTGNSYYFVDLRSDLKPVGCTHIAAHRITVFEKKREAMKIVDHLVSLGYSVRVVPPYRKPV